MDSNAPSELAADLKESVATASEAQSKSSSSSVYCSTSNSPTSRAEETVVLVPKKLPMMQHVNGLPGDSSTEFANYETNVVPSNRAYYEQLVHDTKVRMANKFNQLEQESGLVLDMQKFKLPKTDHTTADAFTTITDQNGCKVATNSANNVDNLKNIECLRLENEIKRLKEELVLKNEIIEKMYRIRSQVEEELEDLTVSLFEEANQMVYRANVLRDKAEKDLLEANLKMDMLTAEVEALKTLVITSTPSRPNTHLHPQISSPSKKGDKNSKSGSLPSKSPSNYELGQQKELVNNNSNNNTFETNLTELTFLEGTSEFGEIDPTYYEEYCEWRKSPTLEPMRSDFMKRIYDEEIYPVFNFKNKDLTSQVLRCIENNSLTVESVAGDAFPKKCALLEIPRPCTHRMKTHDERWYTISQLARNRVTAICDLFCYLGYVKNGLVKSDSKHVYWQIMKRRHSIASAKLGFLSSCL